MSVSTHYQALEPGVPMSTQPNPNFKVQKLMGIVQAGMAGAKTGGTMGCLKAILCACFAAVKEEAAKPKPQGQQGVV